MKYSRETTGETGVGSMNEGLKFSLKYPAIKVTAKTRPWSNSCLHIPESYARSIIGFVWGKTTKDVNCPFNCRRHSFIPLVKRKRM